MKPVFFVHHIRTLNDDDQPELLKRKPLGDFNPAHVVIQGEIKSSPGQMGSVTMGSVEDAVKLADAASEVWRVGFSLNTPIYQ
jgi:hypothetical protein